VAKPTNDRNQAVTRFCLSMEEHRRTEAGRVRTARDFVTAFFPYDDRGATDKLFKLMPNDVRGPILSTWGIRGGKAALKDDDAKVQSVVHDAFVAGDIDDAIFEEGLTPSILVDWVKLGDWWAFWRSGKLTGVAIQKALATARELQLIEDRWFLSNIEARGGKLKGTDVVCDSLTKDQVVAWMRKLHASGDGSPAGMVSAIGWETILTKTSQDALLHALDAFARKVGLVPEVTPKVAEPAAVAASTPPDTLDGRTDAPRAGVEAGEGDETGGVQHRHSGLPTALPAIPAIDAAEEDPTGTSGPPDQARWGAVGESPKLVEARAKMMEMLGSPAEIAAPTTSDAWTASDVPQKPSSLEWPEPPPITVDEPKGSKAPPLPKKGPAPTPRR
jgi:hypothetical protein